MNGGGTRPRFFLGAPVPWGALHDHKRFGSVTGGLGVDFAALQKRKDRFVKGSVSTLSKSLQSAGGTLVDRRASITGAGAAAVAGDAPATLKGKDIVITTGPVSGFFPGIEPARERVTALFLFLL